MLWVRAGGRNIPEVSVDITTDSAERLVDAISRGIAAAPCEVYLRYDSRGQSTRIRLMISTVGLEDSEGARKARPPSA